jgi:hypothetical protein
MSRGHKRSLFLLAVFLIAMMASPALRKLIMKYVPDDIQRASVLSAMGWSFYCCYRIFFIEEPAKDETEQTHEDNAELRENPESPFVILGVDPKASGQEIRQAYRSLAAKHHPDHFPEHEKSKAANHLARIHRAYQVVGSVESRFDYDFYVKSCWPGFPALEEAYAFMQSHRTMVDEILEEAERKRTPKSLRDQEDVPAALNRTEKNAGVYVPVDQAVRIDGGTAGAPAPQEVSDTPPLELARSAECPACGEPNSIPQGRSGVIYCERCGEELTRSGGQ